MCGRFVRKRAAAAYSSFFQVPLPEVPPSYNVAPSQPVLAIRAHDGQPQGAVLRVSRRQMPATGGTEGHADDDKSHGGALESGRRGGA